MLFSLLHSLAANVRQNIYGPCCDKTGLQGVAATKDAQADQRLCNWHFGKYHI